MFKLYDMNILKLINDYDSEYKLIKGIESLINEDSRFLVKTRKNKGDIIFLSIRNMQDFIDYKERYNHKLILNKSCVELKREILDLDEKRKKR